MATQAPSRLRLVAQNEELARENQENEKKNAAIEKREDKRKAQGKALKLTMSQALTVGGVSALRGALKAKTGLYNYGVGGFAIADLMLMGGGLVLGLQKNQARSATGMGLFYAGLAPIAEQVGGSVAASLPSLGGS